jgi:hypothetical protein
MYQMGCKERKIELKLQQWDQGCRQIGECKEDVDLISSRRSL